MKWYWSLTPFSIFRLYLHVGPIGYDRQVNTQPLSQHRPSESPQSLSEKQGVAMQADDVRTSGNGGHFSSF